MLMRNRSTTVSVVVILLCCFASLTAPPAHAQKAPEYRVDPFWPKRLPNKWSMQQVVDIYVDKDDHIWAINRADDARPDELGAMTMPPPRRPHSLARFSRLPSAPYLSTSLSSASLMIASTSSSSSSRSRARRLAALATLFT